MEEKICKNCKYYYCQSLLAEAECTLNNHFTDDYNTCVNYEMRELDNKRIVLMSKG